MVEFNLRNKGLKESGNKNCVTPAECKQYGCIIELMVRRREDPSVVKIIADRTKCPAKL